jgi:arabinan endo-1,5-alpha-L-arabinosidase
MNLQSALVLIAGLVPCLATTLHAGHFNLEIRDPVMLEQDGTYYLFGTGKGISVFSSKDMKTWGSLQPVFSEPPSWVARQLPKPADVFRSPDITLHNGVYYLYYSVSFPGSNNAAIGVATNRAIDPASPNFKWVDHGLLVESVTGRDLFNAVDPSVSFDDQGTPWLALGSFWDGIKIVKLNPNLTEIAEPQEWRTIAARDRNWKLEETYAGDEFSGAVESPSIYRKNGNYYLLTSWGNSSDTSRIVAGRSEKITGPYLSKEGVPMHMGGGSLVVGGTKNWPGAGHGKVYSLNGKEYLVFDACDASDQGRSKLWIQEIRWNANGWPEIDLE